MAFSKVLSAVLLSALAALQPCRGQASTRIVGGSPVGSDRFPYFALLKGVYVKNGKMFVETCGGTLITSQVILVRNMECKRHSSIAPLLAHGFLDFVLRNRRRPIVLTIL